MENMSRMVLVGSAAREFLASRGEAQLIGVFRQSAYAENAFGQIACIGGREVGPGPLHALCEFPGGVDFRAKAAPRDRVMIENGWMRIGPEMRIDASRPEEWKPERLPADWDGRTFRRNLPFLAERIASRGIREGLAPFIPPMMRGERVSCENVLQQALWRGVGALRSWLPRVRCAEKSRAHPLTEPGLIGLGPGLTPSGDDFWCGVMIALHALGWSDEALRKISGEILARAGERTNRISRAHLACAARGQGADALHRAIAAMGLADEERLGSALCAVESIGHTSGWDSLAGVVCVLTSMEAWRGDGVPA